MCRIYKILLLLLFLIVPQYVYADGYDYTKIGMGQADPQFEKMDECGQELPGHGGCRKGDTQYYKGADHTSKVWDKPHFDSKFKAGIRQPSGVSEPKKAFKAP